jgi:N,N'-diacetylchitobiose phosphorylase
MQFGYYDDKTKEYVITNPETPTPWINYLGSEKYCGLVSHNAGGYSFYRSPKSGRFLRFRYNNLPMDRPGRYLYLRDDASGDFWTASWQPAGKSLKEYKTETRHGLGYTRINSLYAGIETDALYFVPIGEDLEIWALTARNNGQATRRLSVFSYAELAFWDAMLDLVDFQYILNMCRTRVDEKTAIMEYDVGLPGRPRVFAFASACGEPLGSARDGLRRTAPLAGWDCDREVFTGPHRGESNPIVVAEGVSRKSIATGGNPCASFHVRLDLAAGAEETIVFVLGVGRADREGLAARKKYGAPGAVRAAFEKLARSWEEKLASLRVATPDKVADATINVLNPYQAHTTFNWSRSASYYESGTLRDGLGYRDSNQDALAVLPSVPGRVRGRILSLAGAIYEDGSACHTFQPLSGEGSGGHDYSDDHLWPVLTVAAYVKETGDLSVLDEEVPFFDNPKKRESLLDRLGRTVAYAFSRRGRHGLCLGLHADWNDCLNLSNGGESVWTTELLFLAAKIFAELAGRAGKRRDADKFDAAAAELKRALGGSAWDGEWFLRAYTGDGRKIGSRKNPTGAIYLIPNAWAVISGAADRERGMRAMDAVRERLFTPWGLMLLSPAYREPDPELGAISLFPPSLKENGGVFAHTNPWAVIAEAMLGRGDRAFEYWRTMAPLAANDRAEVRKTEPYVYAQFLAGSEHRIPGEARNSWLTGSASWNYVAAAQYLLGLRPEYAGLAVDPCLPRAWDGFTAIRRFRGTTYEIAVKNPNHVCKGIASITVDGRKIEGQILPVFANDGKTHRVEAVMG